MALHSELSIYKVSYDLLDFAIDLIRNMPRDVKLLIGAKIRDECLALTVLILRANKARDKVPHLAALVERLQEIEVLIRISRDKRIINVGQYAKAVGFTQSIGRQATAWSRHSAASPAA